MRSERAGTKQNTKGSGIWTAVGWLAFAIPFCLYIILHFALGAGLGA